MIWVAVVGMGFSFVVGLVAGYFFRMGVNE